MLHRVGAIVYVLWGALHRLAAFEGYRMAMALEPGLIQGRLLQTAWYLAFFSLVAILVAIFMNWRNSPVGFWVNLIAVSAADIGFILFVLLPGHIPLWPGLLGPILWILALIASTLGYRAGSASGRP